MMRPFLISIFIFSLSLEASAKKFVYYWGGGGEPETRSTTIFDRDFEAMAPKLLEAGYEFNLAFAVGHSQSEKTAERFLGKNKNKPFTPATVQKELENLVERINSQEIKSGDQLLFVISTHGDNPDDHPDVLTHMVRTTNFKKPAGVGLDRLFVIRDLAEKNNIRLAIMDLSCYSGSTLALATAKTCVLASSTAQELSYTGFAPEVARYLKPGTNFESAFLAARRYDTAFEAPEISSFANSMAKIKTILNSSGSSPVKPATSMAAINRQLNFLDEVFGMKNAEIAQNLSQIPDHPELETMKKIREEYQATLLKKDKLSFEQLDNAKGRAVIRYYYNERLLYEKIYHQFENVPGPNPCRDYKF